MADESSGLRTNSGYFSGLSSSKSRTPEVIINRNNIYEIDEKTNALKNTNNKYNLPNLKLVDDREDYVEAQSLDVLEEKYYQKLREKELEEDTLDLEMDVITPPKIEGYVDKETGVFVETPYIPAITKESIEKEQTEKEKNRIFNRWTEQIGELVDLGDDKDEILKNGKAMEKAILETYADPNVRKDPIVFAMAKLAGSGGAGSKVFEKVINGITLGIAGGQDILEAGLTELKQISPSTFDLIDRTVNLGMAAEDKTPSGLTDKISKSLGAAAEFAETTGAFGFPQLLIRTSSHMRMKKGVKNEIKKKTNPKLIAAQKKFLETAKRNNINNVRHRKAEADLLIQSQADKIARVEVELVDNLLNAMEERVGRDLSKIDENGIRSVDMDKVKKAGVAITEDIDRIDQRSLGVVDLSFDDADSFVMPVLKPEKFNRLVAVVKDLAKNDPTKFPSLKKGSNTNLLDDLFDLALKTDPDSPGIIGTELGDVLIKYGLSYEDYMLAAIGSGSTAGKILNKLSQMVKAASPESIARAQRKNKNKKLTKDFRKGFVRLESIRRGGLVSQLATAARNLSSAVIRTPLETLGSVMDTTLLKFAEAPNYGEGIKAALDVATPLTRGGAENWSNSFSMYTYMFKDMDTAKKYSEFLLEEPEFKTQFDQMFETLNEIQKASGRGKGKLKGASKTTKAFDFIYSEAEDIVSVLNIPNRWQEMLVRRGAFFSEIQRLAKREWDIDLIEELQNNNIRKLIGDSPEFKPKGKLSFAEMMEQSTRKALDITYAKEPETAVFRSASRFIVNNGLTVVIPFPRFMFATMELMGNYAAGASIPLTRFISRNVGDVSISRNLTKLSDKEFKNKYKITKEEMIKDLRSDEGTRFGTYGKTGIFSDKATGQLDRQRVIRNIQGASVALAAYMYRSSEDAPANSYEMYIGDNAVVDVSAQCPMRQYLWVGEQTKQVKEGTFYSQDPKLWWAEASKTFLGANFRFGQGAMLLDEAFDILNETDLSRGQNSMRLIGRSMANWLGSWAVPAAQLIDVQRVIGDRTVKFKDHSKEPTFSKLDTFMNEIKKPFLRFGDPKKEEQLPDSPYIFSKDKERVSPISKIAFGLNMYTRDEPWAEYTKSLGIKEWIIDSESKVPSVKRVENRLIKEHFPTVVRFAKKIEEKLKEEYKNSNEATKESETEKNYIKRNVKKYIETQISAIKQKVKEGKFKETSDLVKAQVTYRKMTSYQKEEAHFLFVQRVGEEPDPNNVKDLKLLKFLGGLAEEKYK